MKKVNYEYKNKDEDKRNDLKVNFNINLNKWLEFKSICEKNTTTPSKELRIFINTFLENYNKLQ